MKAYATGRLYFFLQIHKDLTKKVTQGLRPSKKKKFLRINQKEKKNSPGRIFINKNSCKVNNINRVAHFLL